MHINMHVLINVCSKRCPTRLCDDKAFPGWKKAREHGANHLHSATHLWTSSCDMRLCKYKWKTDVHQQTTDSTNSYMSTVALLLSSKPHKQWGGGVHEIRVTSVENNLKMVPDSARACQILSLTLWPPQESPQQWDHPQGDLASNTLQLSLPV